MNFELIVDEINNSIVIYDIPGYPLFQLLLAPLEVVRLCDVPQPLFLRDIYRKANVIFEIKCKRIVANAFQFVLLDVGPVDRLASEGLVNILQII